MKKVAIVLGIGLLVFVIFLGISNITRQKLYAQTLMATQTSTTIQAPQKVVDKDQELKDEQEVEKEEMEETKEVKEVESKNLPNGGHQDQDGVNLEHQFEGIE